MHPLFHPINLQEETLEKIESFCRTWDLGLDISIQTSGSTGKPKSIQFSKEQLIASAKKTNAFFQLNKESKGLLCLSPDTIGGKMMMVRALVGQFPLYISEASLNPLNDFHMDIDFIALVPAQVHQILQDHPDKLKHIAHILIGGADISMNLMDQLSQHEIRAHQSFGMTETISHVALREIGVQNSDIYEGLPGVTFSTKDHRLCIHYPDIQAEIIETNDEVELIDATHFRWLGRTDFVINSGGKKIHPETLEQQFTTIIEGPFFLSSIPDDTWGQALVCVCEREQSISKDTFSSLVRNFEIPKFMAFTTFIHTKSGKVNRRETQAKITAHDWIRVL
jgi:O-succinylbenzoic acid--CoA ligase